MEERLVLMRQLERRFSQASNALRSCACAVPPHPEQSVTETVPLTVLADHVATLKAALAKAESELEIRRPEPERAERLAVETATAPVLREALSELKAERDHWQLLATDLMQRRRRWWSWRQAS
jgi:hypothetical protein